MRPYGSIVFKQDIADGKLEVLEHRHRTSLKQSSEPAVKGSDLNRLAAGQHVGIQPCKLGRQMLDLILGHAAAYKLGLKL